MATDVKLIAKQPFHAFGVDYAVGDVIDPKVAASWPGQGTLKRRLENGWCAYEEVEDADSVEAAVETAKAKAVKK